MRPAGLLPPPITNTQRCQLVSRQHALPPSLTHSPLTPLRFLPSPAIPAQAKKDLGYKEEDDGCFWISWGDFQNHFNRIYVCRVAETCDGSQFTPEAALRGNRVPEGTWCEVSRCRRPRAASSCRTPYPGGSRPRDASRTRSDGLVSLLALCAQPPSFLNPVSHPALSPSP